MENPRLSVITPVYNGQNVLEEMISQLMITNKSLFFELVLVNDGSTDGTARLIQSLAERYPNIYYVNKENGGIASARNLGLTIAKGKYVAFADQDDTFFAPYQPILDILETSGADFLMSDYKINENGVISHTNNIPNDAVLIGDELKDLLREYIGEGTLPYLRGRPKVRPLTSVWQGIYRKEFLLNNGITFLKFVDYEDDYFFLIQALSAASSVYVTHNGFYVWHIRSESVSHSSRYVTNFYSKRKQYNEWLLNMARRCGLTESELYSFRRKLWWETILFAFINASNAPVDDFGKPPQVRLEMAEIIKAEKNKFIRYGSVNGCFKHRIEYWILLKLLLCERYEWAYYLNNNFFRRTI